MRMTPNRLRWGLNLWPPFLLQGIRVSSVASDFSAATVKLRLSPLNRNIVGSAFGGALSSMTDPLFMLLIMSRLGPEYLVWDTSAKIDFVRPGKTRRLVANFHIPSDSIDSIVERAASGSKVLEWFEVSIFDDHGELVATSQRQVYIRRKKK